MGEGTGLWLDSHGQFPEILIQFTSPFAAQLFIFICNLFLKRADPDQRSCRR
jgi:hypothetical protein